MKWHFLSKMLKVSFTVASFSALSVKTAHCLHHCNFVLLQDCVSEFRHNVPVFHCDLCLQMCVTVPLRSPRDVSVWGNRKKYSVCVSVSVCMLAWTRHCYQPHTGERGCCPVGNEPAFGSPSTDQSKERSHVFLWQENGAQGCFRGQPTLSCLFLGLWFYAV